MIIVEHFDISLNISILFEMPVLFKKTMASLLLFSPDIRYQKVDLHRMGIT